MSVLYLVVPLAVAVVAIALGAFVWATRQGQFDDLDTPSMRMLNDDADGGGPEKRGDSIRSRLDGS